MSEEGGGGYITEKRLSGYYRCIYVVVGRYSKFTAIAF